jgi:hypothetical protein
LSGLGRIGLTNDSYPQVASAFPFSEKNISESFFEGRPCICPAKRNNPPQSARIRQIRVKKSVTQRIVITNHSKV